MTKRRPVHARTARGSAPAAAGAQAVQSAVLRGKVSHADSVSQRRDSGNSISSADTLVSIMVGKASGSRSDGSLRGGKALQPNPVNPSSFALTPAKPPFGRIHSEESQFPPISHVLGGPSRGGRRHGGSPSPSMASVESSSIAAASVSDAVSANADAAPAPAQARARDAASAAIEDVGRRGNATSARRRKAQLLRKTETCAAWQVGACPLSAAECDFAHGKEDLRSIPIEERTRKKLVPSTQAFRTIPCQKFTAVGWCPYGAKCTFIHDPRAVTDSLLDAACVPVRRLQTTSSAKAVTQMNAAVDAVLSARSARGGGVPAAAAGSLECVTAGQVYNPPCILDVDVDRRAILWASLTVVDVNGERRHLTQSELNQQVEALAWYAFAANMQDEWHAAEGRLPTASRVGMVPADELHALAEGGKVAGDPYVMPPTRSSPGVLKFAAPPTLAAESDDPYASASAVATADIAEAFGVAPPDHTSPSVVASALAAIRPTQSRFAALFDRMYGLERAQH